MIIHYKDPDEPINIMKCQPRVLLPLMCPWPCFVWAKFHEFPGISSIQDALLKGREGIFLAKFSGILGEALESFIQK